MTAPAAETSDQTIVPGEARIDVAGIPAKVGRLRSRELLALVRVLTTGLGEGIADVKFTTDDREQLQSEVVALMMLAVPNAIDEFGEFLFSVVHPVHADQRDELAQQMRNPEMDVLVDVIEAIATQEKDELTQLVGKAKAAMGRIQALYQRKPASGSTGRSRARSTSSKRNTAGQTSRSST